MYIESKKVLCSLGSLCSEIKAKSMLWLSSSLLKLLADDIMPLTFRVKILQKGVVIRSRIDIVLCYLNSGMGSINILTEDLSCHKNRRR